MSDVRISQLTKATTISGNEYIPVTQPDVANGNVPTTFYTSPSAMGEYIKDVLIPPGIIWPFAGDLNPKKNLIPRGWLLCNGAILQVKNYKRLYSVIRDSYGYTAAPSILFKLPDLRGRFILGYNSTATNQTPSFGNFYGNPITFGSYGGEFNHKLTIPEIPNHTHTATVYPSEIPFLSYTGGDGDVEQDQVGAPDGPGSSSYRPKFPLTILPYGGSGYHNTTPPYLTMNYLIKY